MKTKQLRTLDQMTNEEAITIGKLSLCNVQGNPEFRVFKKEEENYDIGFHDDEIIVGYTGKGYYHYCIIDELFDVSTGWFRKHDLRSWYSNQQNFNATTFYLLERGFIDAPIDSWVHVNHRHPTKEDGDRYGNVMVWDSISNSIEWKHWKVPKLKNQFNHWQPLPGKPIHQQ